MYEAILGLRGKQALKAMHERGWCKAVNNRCKPLSQLFPEESCEEQA